MPLYNRSVLTLGSVDFTFIDKTDMVSSDDIVVHVHLFFVSVCQKRASLVLPLQEDEIQPASNPNLAPAPLGYDADRDPAYAQPPPDMV